MSRPLETTLSPLVLRWVRVVLVAAPLVLWILTCRREPWGDELHFLDTVRLFGRGLSVELLRTYPEMSAPLTYLVYAAWGHVAGFDTPALRLLSPIIGSSTFLLWFQVLRARTGTNVWALLGMATFALNPYVVGLSAFVFTDMLALLGLAVVTHGVERDRPRLVALGVAVATLSRQYLVFLVPALLLAVAVAHAWPAPVEQPRRNGGHALAALAGLLPLGVLVVGWGGHLAPASPLRDIYLADGLRFDLHALSLYLASAGAYLLPVSWRAFRIESRRTWALAACAAALVLAFTVQPSPAQVREGRLTVGFLHRGLVAVLPMPLASLVFAGLASMWTAATIDAAAAARRMWRGSGATLADLFPWTGVVSFLLVMPWSYMPWEKYALPLFMLGSLCLLPSSPQPADLTARAKAPNASAKSAGW